MSAICNLNTRPAPDAARDRPIPVIDARRRPLGRRFVKDIYNPL